MNYDELASQDTLKKTAEALTTKGYEVVVVKNGQEALEKLENGFKPDIIISDIIMPGMDGAELIKNIREQHLADSAKIIVLSNQGDSPDIGRAQKIGIDGYIVKATSVPSEVVKLVEEILNKK